MSSRVSRLQPAAVAMERENNAESMRKWREKKEEKKKASKKKYYEKNKVKISQQYVEKKSKMAEEKRPRASSNTGRRGRTATATAKTLSTERVRKFRLKKAAEKEEEERRKRLSKERSRRYRDKKLAGVLTGQSVMPTVSPGSSFSPSTFQSRMAKKRAVDKTKSVLPKTPEKKVEIITNLVCSPRTRKALHEKGLVKSPEEEKEVEALRAVATDLSGAIKVLKHDKKKESQAAFGAMKSLAFGETVKKKRLTSSVSKLVSLNRRSISKGIKRRAEVLKGDEPSWLFAKRKPRIDSVKEEVKQTICQFWTYEASRPTGDKKYCAQAYWP